MIQESPNDMVRSLLIDQFQLLIDDLICVSIERDVQPVSTLAFNQELGEICRRFWITPRLGNDINQ